jgi:hypothetical protein
MRRAVEKLKSSNYQTIIQVNVPVRFYWTTEGYDGLEFGPLPYSMTKYQLGLLTKILTTLQSHMDNGNIVKDPK